MKFYIHSQVHLTDFVFFFFFCFFELFVLNLVFKSNCKDLAGSSCCFLMKLYWENMILQG